MQYSIIDLLVGLSCEYRSGSCLCSIDLNKVCLCSIDLNWILFSIELNRVKHHGWIYSPREGIFLLGLLDGD